MLRITRSSIGQLKIINSKLEQRRNVVATAKSQELKSIKEVPGPFTVPFLGSSVSMLMTKDFHPLKFHKYWFYASKKYGDIFYLELFGVKSVCLGDPDDIQKLFEATKDSPDRMGMESIRRVRYEMENNYLEGKGGLLIEDGEEWWRVRKRTQGPMMKPKLVKSYLDSHNQVALEFLEIIKGFQEKHGEMPANFQEDLYKWALESVALVAFDRRLGCLQPNLSKDSEQVRFIRDVNLFFQSVNDTELGLRLWRLFETKEFKALRTSHNNIYRVADANIRKTVELLKNKPKDADATLLETFLMTDGLSYKDVSTMVMDMLFAGIDTTSHTIAFALYLLSRNKEKQRNVQKEIDDIFGDRQDFTTADFAKLFYTKAVIKETFRLFPLGFGNLRLLNKDFEVKGYLIPKGYGVFTMNMIPSVEEKYFPQADKFIPERWLRSRPLGPIHPFASLPFGSGTRMCIGRRIAEQEMYVFLVRVLQRFNVDYKYQDMDIKTKLVFAPSEPLRFNFTERK